MSNRSILSGWRQRWNRNLLRFLGSRVRSPVDIEDLAQETYLRLLRVRDLDDVRNPQAYLLRVASHVVADWRDSQPASDSFEAANEDALVEEYSPEFDMEAEVSQTRFEQALAAMPSLTRTVLLLKFREGYSRKVIAAHLELSDRQVIRHLTRGYEHLRRVIED